MFDALLSLLFESVENVYLLPGHSHMTPDRVVGLCKQKLKNKNLFMPKQLATEMASVSFVRGNVAFLSQFQCNQ